MTNRNALPSERFGLVGVIDADAYTANTYTTGWIDASRYHSFLAMIAVGDLGASAVVNAKFEQATDASGTGAKDLSPAKAITALTQAGTDDNKQALMNLRPEELDVNNGFDHFRLSVALTVATSDLAAYVFGTDARYAPVADYDLSTVDEIVS